MGNATVLVLDARVVSMVTVENIVSGLSQLVQLWFVFYVCSQAT